MSILFCANCISLTDGFICVASVFSSVLPRNPIKPLFLRGRFNRLSQIEFSSVLASNPDKYWASVQFVYQKLQMFFPIVEIFIIYKNI